MHKSAVLAISDGSEESCDYADRLHVLENAYRALLKVRIWDR